MHRRIGVIEKIFKINKNNIAFFQFIMEGYEGLATVTTIDKNQALVKLFIMPCFLKDADDVIDNLKSDLKLEEVHSTII